MRKKRVLSAIAVAVLLSVGAALAWATPRRDTREVGPLPPSCSIAQSGNSIDLQAGSECAAYAAAYVMRHFGVQITGTELYPQIRRSFGFVSVGSVARLLREYGFEAECCHGDLGTLRQRLCDGDPIIAFTAIPGDAHYVVVTGYDEEYVYIADSLAENANADGGWYNRRLRIAEFGEIWKTHAYFVDNVYIVVHRPEAFS